MHVSCVVDCVLVDVVGCALADVVIQLELQITILKIPNRIRSCYFTYVSVQVQLELAGH